MNVALLGPGRTGKHVAKLHAPTTAFHSARRPTPEGLKGHDVVISFLPGAAFLEYAPMLVASRLPVVVGSTGVPLQELDDRLKEARVRWAWSANFALGMQLARRLVSAAALADALFGDYRVSIRDTHHKHKRDAPSGTALSWKEWLGEIRAEVEMTSVRAGDVVGRHELVISTEHETLAVSHEALDRSVFAAGALRAAQLLLDAAGQLEAGLHNASDLVISGRARDQ